MGQGEEEAEEEEDSLSRKVYVLVTHGIFSGSCSLILQEATNLEKVEGEKEDQLTLMFRLW